MNVVEALRIYNTEIWSKRGLLVRHADARWDLERVARAGCFDEYQANQGRDLFKSDFIVSFMGEGRSRSRFLGVFEVGKVSEKPRRWSKGFPFPEMPRARFTYELTRVPDFEELEDRLIVDWGSATRSWVQRLRPDHPKSVIEILPTGHVREFPGYENVLVRFDELERIVRAPEANRTWHKMLAEVAAVYLITDSETGNQYVGSAYGEAGLLGRWASYVRTKHGGNARLRALLEAAPSRFMSFSFSILRTLPRSLTRNEVIAAEAFYKAKLGARAFGLNAN